MHPAPIKVSRAPRGATYVSTLVSGESLYSLDGTVYAVQPAGPVYAVRPGEPPALSEREKILEAILPPLSELLGGDPIAVSPAPDRTVIRAHEHVIVIAAGEDPGLTTGDLLVLVQVCDAYLQLLPALQELPGARPFPDDVRQEIVAAREKLRARL